MSDGPPGLDEEGLRRAALPEGVPGGEQTEAEGMDGAVGTEQVVVEDRALTDEERHAILQHPQGGRSMGCCGSSSGCAGRSRGPRRHTTHKNHKSFLDDCWPRREFDAEGPTVDEYPINASGTVKPMDDTDEDWIPAGKREEVEALCKAQDWQRVREVTGVDVDVLRHESDRSVRKTHAATAAMILAAAYPRPQDWTWCLVFKCECPNCEREDGSGGQLNQCPACQTQTMNRVYIERMLQKSCLQYAKSMTRHNNKHNRIFLRIRESSQEQLLAEAERVKMMRSIAPLHKDINTHMEGAFSDPFGDSHYREQQEDVRARIREQAQGIFDDLDQDRSRTMSRSEFMTLVKKCHVKKDDSLLEEIFQRLDEEDDGTPGEIAYAAFERWFVEDQRLSARNFVMPAHADLHADIGCAPYTRTYHKFFDNRFKSGARQELVRSIFEEELNKFVQTTTNDIHARRMGITDLKDDAATNERLYPVSPDAERRGEKNAIAAMSPFCRDVFALHCPSELQPLQQEWASFATMKTCRCWQWSQTPLNSIREYYGEEIAMYYAWLLMYTHALFLPAIVGLVCFLVQWSRFFTADNNNIYMSPNSNVLTAVYAIFLCVWSCMFIQKWRRREAVLKFRWGTEGYRTSERTRKEYDGECNQDKIEKKVIDHIKKDTAHTSMADVSKLDGRDVVAGMQTVIQDLADYVKDEREKKAHQKLSRMRRSCTSAGLLMLMVAMVVIVCTVAMYMKGLSVIACHEGNATRASMVPLDSPPSASCISFVSQNQCGETVGEDSEQILVRDLCADLCTNWEADNCTILRAELQCTAGTGRQAACTWMGISSELNSGGSCADACMNRRRDADEDGIDCGGPCSATCPEEICMHMIVWQVGSVALSVVSIFVFEAIYKLIAATLTSWENWRTRSQYEDALILKNFIFAFVNNYFFIFFIALFKHGQLFGISNTCMPRAQSYWSDAAACPEFDEHGNCVVPDCMYDLQIQLMFVFIAKVYGKLVWKHMKPLIFRGLLKIQDGGDDGFHHISGNSAEKSQLEIEEQMDGFEWVVLLFDNYDDRIIEFGFMTLFAAAFPLAPLLAWVANHFELKVDAQLLVGHVTKNHCCRPKSIGRTGLRRPPVMKTEGLGAWQSVMNAMSIVSIMTNAFIIGLLSTLSAQAFKLDTGTSMWDRVSHGELWVAVVVVEHLALFFRTVVERLVPAQPSWLLAQRHNRELFMKYVMTEQPKLQERDLGSLGYLLQSTDFGAQAISSVDEEPEAEARGTE